MEYCEHAAVDRARPPTPLARCSEKQRPNDANIENSQEPQDTQNPNFYTRSWITLIRVA